MSKLDGKVALVTGAGSGIGRATAVLFASEGAKVAVIDCVPAGGKATVKKIHSARNSALFIEADVSRSADVQRMIETTMATYGRLDILHNNASIQGPLGSIEDLAEDDWDKLIDTDLKSVFLGAKYAIPVMKKQGGGIIINTASAGGIIGLPNTPAYCAAKAGVIQLTRTLAITYSRQNIRINCICPGSVDTPMLGLHMPADPEARKARMKGLAGGRPIRPEEIAKAALFLACDDSSSVIGAAWIVDRGLLAGR